MKKGTRWLGIFALMVVLFCATHLVYVVVHEKVHYQNCRYYGGIPEYVYELSLNLSGQEWGLPRGVLCRNSTSESRVFVDSMNEVVGYHAFALIIALFACAFVVVLALFEVDGGVKNEAGRYRLVYVDNRLL